MQRVILETPYAGKDWAEIKKNERYARLCMRDCLQRGEAPYASYLLYTQANVLRDDIPEERKLGMQAGFAWRQAAQATAVYTNLGISDGMKKGIEDADQRGCPVEYRTIEYPPQINTVYLAGPMEFAEEAGLRWREEYAEILQDEFGIKSIIPNNEERDIIPSQEEFIKLKERDTYEYIRLMTQLRDMDLRFVQQVDAVICRYAGEKMAGTIGEAQHATFHATPFYLIHKVPIKDIPGWFLSCCTDLYPSFSCFLIDLADLKYGKKTT